MHCRSSLIATVLILISASARPAEILPLQLTQQERSEVEQMACQVRHGVASGKIDGRAYGRGTSASAVAEVSCAPHGQFAGYPLRHVVECSREQGKWDCPSEWQEILVATASDPIAVRVEGATTLVQAHRIIRTIAGAGMFQGYPLPKTLVPPCYVHQGKTQEFIDVKCRGWHVIVSTWCPQSDCPRVISMAKTGD